MQEIINTGENQSHSFEGGVHDEFAIIQLLTSFANSSGGSLFIGINKKGKITGCNPKQIIEDVTYYINKYTKPNLYFESKTHQHGHKFVLEIIVPKSELPCQALDLNFKSNYYIRYKATTFKANKIIGRFLHLKYKISTESDLKLPAFNEQLLSFIVSKTAGVTLSQIYSSHIDIKKNLDDSLSILLLKHLIRFEFEDNKCYYFANKS
mgnify:FL=1